MKLGPLIIPAPLHKMRVSTEDELQWTLDADDFIPPNSVVLVGIWIHGRQITPSDNYGRLAILGTIARDRAPCDSTSTFTGVPLQNWWTVTYLHHMGLRSLVGHPGELRKPITPEWNRLIRAEMGTGYRQARRLRDHLIPDPPPIVKMRPSRSRIGDIEWHVLREAARGNYWRPGRGRWR